MGMLCFRRSKSNRFSVFFGLFSLNEDNALSIVAAESFVNLISLYSEGELYNFFVLQPSPET